MSKWTGRGILTQGKKEIYPGEEIPDGFLTKEAEKLHRKKGNIDGKISGDKVKSSIKSAEANAEKKGADAPVIENEKEEKKSFFSGNK